MVIHDLRLPTDALIAKISRTVQRLEATLAQLDIAEARNIGLETKLVEFKAALMQLNQE